MADATTTIKLNQKIIFWPDVDRSNGSLEKEKIRHTITDTTAVTASWNPEILARLLQSQHHLHEEEDYDKTLLASQCQSELESG